MLNKESLLERYKIFRKYSVKFSGREIADLEKIMSEVFASHNLALERIEKLEEQRKPKEFEVYWADGKIEILRGIDIADALNSAGYGAGSLAALDYWKTA